MLALVVVATGCQAPERASVATQDPQKEAHALVEGLGGERSCRTDHDCAVGASEAACMLGACFGILTTDIRTARQLVVGRLRQASAPVRNAAWPLLKKAMTSSDSSPLLLAAVDGTGALLAAQPDPPGQCGEPCLALRRAATSTEEHVAVAARLALGRAGDPTVVAALTADLQGGTELLRTEATRALEPALGRGDAGIQAALLERLTDPSPVVQEAAIRALRTVAARPEVRAGLQAVKARTPHLAYPVDEVLAGG